MLAVVCELRSTPSLVNALEKIVNHSHEESIKMELKSRKKIEAEFDEKNFY